MPRPTDEVMQELRTLYIQRQTLSNQINGVLDRIGYLLHQQEDYKEWFRGDGLIDSLPPWIHEVTGGRPFYSKPQRPVVQRRRTKRKGREPVLSEEFQDGITSKLDKILQRKGGE